MKQIKLSSGRIAIVDNEDYENLKNYHWYFSNGYARRNAVKDGKRIQITMHRQLMGFPVGFQIDHIDQNKLNNQKSNLRVCTNAQNSMNRKVQANNKYGLKGVFFDKYTNKYRARINYKGKTIYLGRHKDIKDAGISYDKKALELFGEFAFLNFPKN